MIGGNVKMVWMLVQPESGSTISPNVYVNAALPYGSVGPALGWVHMQKNQGHMYTPQK